VVILLVAQVSTPEGMAVESMAVAQFSAAGAEVVRMGADEFSPRNLLKYHVPAAAHRIGRSGDPTSCDGRPVHVQDVGSPAHPTRHVLARNSVFRHAPGKRKGYAPGAQYDSESLDGSVDDSGSGLALQDRGGVEAQARGAQGLGADLVVYITEEVHFADSGGPVLIRVARWAQTLCVPVIAVARQCWISTRELRTVGVEAGYAVASAEDMRTVVATWVGH